MCREGTKGQVKLLARTHVICGVQLFLTRHSLGGKGLTMYLCKGKAFSTHHCHSMGDLLLSKLL